MDDGDGGEQAGDEMGEGAGKEGELYGEEREKFSGCCMLIVELYTPYLAVESIVESIDAGQTPARRWVEARGVR